MKLGRPKLPKRERKGKLLCVRFTDAERRELDAAAKALGASLSEWARLALLVAARNQSVTRNPLFWEKASS